MVCPACLNNDKDSFAEIKGYHVVSDGSGWDRHDQEVSLYACKKCSCVMVSGGWSFQQKEVPGGQE